MPSFPVIGAHCYPEANRKGSLIEDSGLAGKDLSVGTGNT
jgi:hypothetical protein